MTDDAHRDEPSKRLFFALDCPPAQRKAIAQWRAELGLRTGKSVPADNFHLTLLFLGAVPLAQIGGVCEAAGKVGTPGHMLQISLD
ncbi:MAG: 2'-5' RNA ligase family protein, partial [Pseudomonas sp.]